MSLDQWMLAFHVLSAFSLIAGMILFWALIVAGRRIDTPGDTLRLGLCCLRPECRTSL